MFCLTTCLSPLHNLGQRVQIMVKVLVDHNRKCLMTVTLSTDSSQEHVLMSCYQLLITGGTLTIGAPIFHLEQFLAIAYKNTR